MKRKEDNITRVELFQCLYKDDLKEIVEIFEDICDGGKICIQVDEFELDSFNELKDIDRNVFKEIRIQPEFSVSGKFSLDLKFYNNNAYCSYEVPANTPSNLVERLNTVMKRSLTTNRFFLYYALLTVNTFILVSNTYKYWIDTFNEFNYHTTIGALIAIIPIWIYRKSLPKYRVTIINSFRKDTSSFWSRKKDDIVLMFWTALITWFLTGVDSPLTRFFTEKPNTESSKNAEHKTN